MLFLPSPAAHQNPLRRRSLSLENLGPQRVQRRLWPWPSASLGDFYLPSPENVHSNTHLASCEGIFSVSPDRPQLEWRWYPEEDGRNGRKALSTFAHVSSWSRESLLTSKLGSPNSPPTKSTSPFLYPTPTSSHRTGSCQSFRAFVTSEVQSNPFSVYELAFSRYWGGAAASRRTVDIFYLFYSLVELSQVFPGFLQAFPSVLHRPVPTYVDRFPCH